MEQPSPVDAAFSALSDKTRRAVVGLLREKPYRAGELSSALGMEPALLSRHLRLLRRAGIISNEHPDHDARVRLYSLRPEGFASLRAWLDEIEAFWALQLGALAAHMEQKN
jgi:DNA-binding transcriptional ArsR family regulator